jgi:hypothetical protein
MSKRLFEYIQKNIFYKRHIIINMVKKKSDEWCDCSNPEDGVYWNTEETEDCSCGKSCPHIHCRNCGGLRQVS